MLAWTRAFAQSFEFKPNQRYPDPAVQILDTSFARYRIYSSTVEQVYTGGRWLEGPVYFPEGGYLIAGAPNRVYFSARTTLDKPAELQGRLVDQDGKEVTAVRTLNDDKEAGVNQGLGASTFTPRPGRTP